MSANAKRILKIIILTTVSFVISLTVFISGILNVFELKAYDLFSRYLNPLKSSDDIIIVKVDQQSIDAMSEEGITWPWPRQMYAPLVDYLSESDAVFIDILFSETSSYGQQDDLIFSEALKKASNIYLPVFLTNKKKDMRNEDKEFIKKIAIEDTISANLSFSSVLTPIDILKSSVRGSGNVTIPPDEDGVYRKIPLFFKLDNYTIPHFVLGYLINKGIVTVREGSLYAGEIMIPFYKKRLMLRYSVKDEPFKTISAVNILMAYRDSNSSKEPLIKKEFFKGKKVFIGLTAAGLYDLKPTATSPISTGVLIHASTLENIINRDFIRPADNIYAFIFMFFICAFICFTVLKYHSVYINLSIFLISLFITVLIPALLFRNSIYMNIILPSLSLITSFIIAAAYSYATEGKERRFVKKAFSQYMDKNIVEYMLKNPQLIKPGGKRSRVTIFFADIVGFTSLAEKISAEDTAKILHIILNSFTEVIIKNKGVIDKYIGDCIMAFWGAPFNTEKDEINACHAAIQCIESLEEINERFRAEGLFEISMRIGIHSGDAIVGNLGSDRLFDYTVVGDTVNIASRLESANKLFKTKIIISGEALQKTYNIFSTRELGMIEVKGKTAPVRIFELIGENDKTGHNKRDIVTQFNQGITLFNEKRLQEAFDVFTNILKNVPDDGPAEFYKKRCEHLIGSPELTDRWNVIKMTEK